MNDFSYQSHLNYHENKKTHLNKKKTTRSRCMNTRTKNDDFSVFVIHV